MAAALQSTRTVELAASYGFCGQTLREENRDLWLADLFAPADRRKHAHAIHAFVVETAQVKRKVTQPLLGEMRLRWWADAIMAPDDEPSSLAPSSSRDHPIADALIDTIESCGLERQGFADFLDAHVLELYDEPFASKGALLAHCGRIAAAPLRWCAQSLGSKADAQTDAACEDAGVAMALTRLIGRAAQDGLKRLPDEFFARSNPRNGETREERSAGELREAIIELRNLAAAHFARAQEAAKTLDEPSRIALLPAAGVPLYLSRMQDVERVLRGDGLEPSPLRRQWRLWRAARAGL